MTDIMCRVDQREVRERLREIAELAAAAGIVFLGEQPDVVARRQQALEQLARLVVASLQDVVVGEPEAAGRKTPSPGGSPSTSRPLS